jgi:hypothetical protein
MNLSASENPVVLNIISSFPFISSTTITEVLKLNLMPFAIPDP